MIIIRTTAELATYLAEPPDLILSAILHRRSMEWAAYDIDLAELVCITIVQAGEGILALERGLGFPIASNGIDGVRVGQPDFMPSWEWIEDHGGWFELVFVLSDDGFGHVLFVPDADGTDPELLNLCRTYALKSEG